MEVLVTNDDGIEAAGLAALAALAAEEHRVTVVAPAGPRSGVGGGITLRRPVRAEPANGLAGEKAWRVDGLPVDCVKLAFAGLCERRPELVLAGVNHGVNAGRDLLYSGTLAAALEARFLGVPAAAFSLDLRGPLDFRPGLDWARDNLPALLAELGPDQVLSLNFPAADRRPLGVKRVKRSRQGFYVDRYRVSEEAGGARRFDLEEVPDPYAGPADDDGDVAAVREGYITVSFLDLV